jgi:transcriptional regulator with XRE-family HTH domain
MFVKTAERVQARALRRELGLPVKEIARRVGVSTSSVSLWVRDVPLSPDQEAALDARNPVRSGQRIGTQNNASRWRERRRAAQQHGRELARAGEPDFIAGCMLYWAEGSKRRNTADLTNSDADLLDAYLRFLRRHYDVPDAKVAFSVNCFLGNGLALDEIETWWLERLGLPASCLRKASVNRPSSASARKRGNVLAHGTGRISVGSTFIVQSIYGAIQEYAGIDRPEWLDL